MIDLSKILDQDPVDNNVRRMRWQWAWRDHFGHFPRAKVALVRHCDICKKPIWITSLEDITPLKYTCSPKCAEELAELRAENHWS